MAHGCLSLLAHMPAFTCCASCEAKTRIQKVVNKISYFVRRREGGMEMETKRERTVGLVYLIAFSVRKDESGWWYSFSPSAQQGCFVPQLCLLEAIASCVCTCTRKCTHKHTDRNAHSYCSLWKQILTHTCTHKQGGKPFCSLCIKLIVLLCICQWQQFSFTCSKRSEQPSFTESQYSQDCVASRHLSF